MLHNDQGELPNSLYQQEAFHQEPLHPLNPNSYAEEINQLLQHASNIKMITKPRVGKKLLVVDLDHTVLDNDAKADTKEELLRPFLHEFFARAFLNFDILIWSATSMKSVLSKLNEFGVVTNPNYKIVACLDAKTMLKIEIPGSGSLKVKPLAVIWNKFPGVYTPKNTIILDDAPKNSLLNPRNGLLIRPFRDAHHSHKHDKELKYLAQFLEDIALTEDVRNLNFGTWETHRLTSDG